jgi:DNA-binding response OmpR family regulator
MNEKVKILLAEDEPSLGQIIKESLETRAFEVILCENGEQAYKMYKSEKPRLLVLDVMMPKKDGFSLAAEIRKEDLDIPIIFLTAKSQITDIVEGFNVGGNDYLKKPFSMEELIVRMNALLSRNEREVLEESLVIGKFNFDFKKQILQIDSIEESLTYREASLLYYLIKHKNKVLDRSFILKKLWGDDDFFNARSMDVFISKLRKKLQLDPSVKIINVRGFGYKLIG